jgi:hypothetical protein
MLGTLLDKLESLFSKTFVVGTIPLLGFLVLNGALLYIVSFTFQNWIKAYFALDTAHIAVLSFALLMALVVLSYVFSTLTTGLREILEGNHLSRFIANCLSQRYRAKLRDLEMQLSEARRALRKIRLKRQHWQVQMANARVKGTDAKVCTYTRRGQLTALLDRQSANQSIDPALLENEVTAITSSLADNSTILSIPNCKTLDSDQGLVLRLISYTSDYYQAEVLRHFNEIQFDFPGQDVAPTKMGNIANVAAYYAQSRYSMNLEIYWTRLQKVLQEDTHFYPVLQESKMQLDFLVELFWLTVVFTLIWVVALPFCGEGVVLYPVIAIGGPLLTWIWYRIALRNYRAFSDLLRAAVDLYRLDLLKGLHIPLPANAAQECILWENLEQRTAYGDDTNFVLQNT